MASSTTANRPLIGWLLLTAGILLVLQIVLSFAGLGVLIFSFVAAAALVVAFVLLFLVRSVNTMGRTAFLAAAIGWALLALGGLISLGVLGQVGILLILVGSIGGGIIAYLGKLFTSGATTWFLIAMILAGVDMLNAIIGFLPGVAGVVIEIAFAAALVVAGLFIAQRR